MIQTILNRSLWLRLTLALTMLLGLAYGDGIGISPAIINQGFKPGEAFSVEVTLTNTTNTPMLLHGLTTDLWYDAKTNDRTMPLAGSTARSAANWVEFVPKQVNVPAQGHAVVKVVVTPRKDVSGGYYAALFFESVPVLAGTAEDTKQSIFMNFRIGAFLLMTAEGTEKYKVDISDFRVIPPDASHQMVAEFTIDNQSNTHIFPKVQLAVLDSKKHIVGKADGDWIRFMPGQKKVFSVNYPGSLAAGSYDALLTIVHEGGSIVTRDIPFQVGEAVP